VCCSVLQCVAVCCSVLQCDKVLLIDYRALLHLSAHSTINDYNYKALFIDYRALLHLCLSCHK